MKIKPEIYAQILAEAAKTGKTKAVAKQFWQMIQKNKQYKDLPKIMELLDAEAARQENKILVTVYTEKALSADEKSELTKKIKSKLKQEPVLRIQLKKNTTGLIVKYEDKILDLSAETKINKLSQQINSKIGE
jgi:F0F1-type ATP synthase delta subunit